MIDEVPVYQNDDLRDPLLMQYPVYRPNASIPSNTLPRGPVIPLPPAQSSLPWQQGTKVNKYPGVGPFPPQNNAGQSNRGPMSLNSLSSVLSRGSQSRSSNTNLNDRSLLIRHTWNASRHRVKFWLKDQFHVLMSLPLSWLVVCLVIAEALWALLLAVSLYVVTKGDVQGCLGNVDDSIANYFFFTIETIFTIGFGAPRHPACTAANVWTSVAVLWSNVINGCVVGLVFSKFSSSAPRRFALAFSPSLLGSVARASAPPAAHSPATISTRDQTTKEWKRLRSNSYGLLNPQQTAYDMVLSPLSAAAAVPAGAAGSGFSCPINNNNYAYNQECRNCGNMALAVDVSEASRAPARDRWSCGVGLSGEFDDLGFSLSFRLMNLTECAFFDPKLSMFLMKHDAYDLMICQLPHYYTDMPLQFLELPLTVTIGDAELNDALHLNGWPITLQEIIQNGDKYELIVLLSFVDNQSSKLMELRKSWKLSQIQWGYSFQKIVKRSPTGITYQVDVECLDNKTALTDLVNVEFTKLISRSRDDCLDITANRHNNILINL